MTTEPAVSFRDVMEARLRLRKHLRPSPLRHSRWLSDTTGARVLLKLECAQLTNSFKIRGAWNAVLRLSGRSIRTIVTASAGNHGRALACAAEQLGMSAVVYVPANAPETKKAAIRRHHADLREAADYDLAEERARQFATDGATTYVSPYNDPDVIAGAATIALELLEEAPRLDMVVVPVGGGGLASGVGLAIKAAAPDVQVIGVEAEASRPFATSMAHGAITHIEVQPSIADGLIGNLEANSITFDLVRTYVDRLVSVSEVDLRRAIRGLAIEEHLMVEGAGAAATAAVLGHDLVRQGQRVAVLVSGGNIDLGTFCRVVWT